MKNFTINKFYTDADRFFKGGLLTELYSDEDICICNVANQSYAAFNYTDTKYGQLGILGDSNVMNIIVDNPHVMLSLADGLLKDNATRGMVIGLNDKSYAVFNKFKKLTDINGPSSAIDFEFEKKLMERNKKSISK